VRLDGVKGREEPYQGELSPGEGGDMVDIDDPKLSA
jgi:hypothetical protein